jgi:hypothetical protein
VVFELPQRHEKPFVVLKPQVPELFEHKPHCLASTAVSVHASSMKKVNLLMSVDDWL